MATSLPDRSFAAFLFDMDGTLLTSIRSAERVWSAWASRHGLDVETFLPTLHGKRTHDTIGQLGLPGVDPIAEAAWITAAEIEDVADIEAIGGAADFLASLPPARWGIVTSAPRALAKARLAAAGLPAANLLVAAEDVKHGKPAPDPFLLGARLLGVDAADCLVFEDTQTGLRSAAAAGMESIVVTLTHAHPMETDVFGVRDYAELRAVLTPDGRLRVTRAG
ncbi:HAD-IA family hydrolase [Massilia sp. Dwa41.01b]|uniref:HAD-IA family hydrolase n=1 Tax=unclassified Massilia TaxID=2609279 RepID=UPI0016032C24|nr:MULTISPECIES: HAD-IA family hydrolase [unclassified Massilia]QNA90474.1 HAD-IA family hydrolase [Massilia sp. Dwa41.01b]QNA97704.1 HAD-IA family hydrolase [Massilia sp. Se16.2.3]